ncbi:MAG: hypothetical protein IJU14_02540, partial [Clostridia bacterium]|nr:hypothetical protein [Clostridia bacterium]
MKKTIKQCGICLLTVLWMLFVGTVSVSAAPEDYLNDIVDGISSAVERYWNSTEPPAEVTTDTATQPIFPTDSYIYPFDDNDYDDYDESTFPTEEPTEEFTEEPTEEITE